MAFKQKSWYKTSLYKYAHKSFNKKSKIASSYFHFVSLFPIFFPSKTNLSKLEKLIKYNVLFHITILDIKKLL